jgi:hypothetical protein
VSESEAREASLLLNIAEYGWAKAAGVETRGSARA